MWIRTEDLLPGNPSRFQLLQALGEFVGSTLTERQLYCLSKQTIKDYGKSVVHDREPRGLSSETESRHDHHGTILDLGEKWKLQEEEREKNSHRQSMEQREAWLRRTDQKKPPIEHRRLLQSVTQKTPKIVPTGFLRDYDTWHELALRHLSEDNENIKMFVLQGLITHGEDLLEQWDLNHFDDQQQESLQGLVSKVDIHKLTIQLQKKLHEMEHQSRNNQGKQHGRPGDPDVKNRYGKWQSVLKNDTELETYFYQEGGKGLKLFGYEPYHQITYVRADTNSNLTVRDESSNNELQNQENYLC
jgi:hypothetical protein